MLSEPRARSEARRVREWTYVCREDEVEPGRMRPFKVRGRSVLVARRPDGSVRVVANTCPHEAARMSDGKLERMWHGDKVENHYQKERCVVVCPWHNFEFDLDTGRSTVEPERMRLKTYPVEVAEGEILIHV